MASTITTAEDVNQETCNSDIPGTSSLEQSETRSKKRKTRGNNTSPQSKKRQTHGDNMSRSNKKRKMLSEQIGIMPLSSLLSALKVFVKYSRCCSGKEYTLGR